MTAGRLIRIALILVAIWVALFLIGFWLFNSGGSSPGSGEADPVPAGSTP